MGNLKKFSIIIPIYNEENNIEACVNSILNQQGDNYEIILVDDGSTDNSPDICDKLSDNNSLIRVIHKVNGGGVEARRIGIEAATGEFLLFVDADDIVTNDYFSKLNRLVRYRSELYVLNNFIKSQDSKKYVLEKDYLKDGEISVLEMAEWILTGKSPTVWDKVYVTEIFKKCCGKLNQKIMYGDDLYMNLTYLRCIHDIYVKNESIYIHTVGSSTSVCTTNVGLHRIDEIDIIYAEGIRYLNDCDNVSRLKGMFIAVYASVLVSTVNVLYKNGEDIYVLRDKLHNSFFVKNISISDCVNLKGWVYVILLKYKWIRMINIFSWIKAGLVFLFKR